MAEKIIPDAGEQTTKGQLPIKACGRIMFEWAHGVAVSHPLSMREALGSIPSVSTLTLSYHVGFSSKSHPLRTLEVHEVKDGA